MAIKRSIVTVWGLGLVLGLGVPREVAAAPATAQLEALCSELGALLHDPDPQAAAELRRRVEAGLPPGALAVLLDLARRHPRPELLPMLQTLAGYRRVEIRGRALVAWSALGPTEADAAVTLGVDDFDPRIRRLAAALAQANPSPTTDAALARLLQRDPQLFAQDPSSGVPGAPP